MRFLYGLFIALYTLSIRIAALFHEKARSWVAGRKDLFAKLEKELGEKDPVNTRTRAWFHCASLGEFEQGRPVIEAYRTRHPDHLLVVTFFSPSGYEIRKNYPQADIVCYLPPDTANNAKRFISLVRPVSAVFVKYEYWYNYLRALGERGTKIFFISVILRPSQVFFRWYGGWFRKQLESITWFFVQDKVSLDLLKSIGIDNAEISGDTRFDRVYEVSLHPRDIPFIDEFAGGQPVLVAGSTWPEDERMILAAFRQKNMKMIIAPHEIGKERISTLVKNIHRPVILYSQANPENVKTAGVIIIDSIGLLSSLYRYATVAYIGGGFGAGIHNILEAAAFGVPVVFGPNFQKFREARELIALGGARTAENENQLVRILEDFANSRSGAICTKYVFENQGATRCIMQRL